MPLTVFFVPLTSLIQQAEEEEYIIPISCINFLRVVDDGINTKWVLVFQYWLRYRDTWRSSTARQGFSNWRLARSGFEKGFKLFLFFFWSGAIMRRWRGQWSWSCLFDFIVGRIFFEKKIWTENEAYKVSCVFFNLIF